MLLVDAECHVAKQNAAAGQLLEEYSDVLFVEQGTLRFRNSTVMAKLTRALNHPHVRSALKGDIQGQARTALRLIGRPPSQRTLFCSVWSLRPELIMGVFGDQERALHTITAPNSKSAADPIFLGSMFNLTPAEARLAASLLTGGDLRAIAAGYGVTLETLRTQLKSIFRKTNTRRQSELVSLLQQVTTT